MQTDGSEAMVVEYLSDVFELGRLLNDCGVNIEIDLGILELEDWYRENGDFAGLRSCGENLPTPASILTRRARAGML